MIKSNLKFRVFLSAIISLDLSKAIQQSILNQTVPLLFKMHTWFQCSISQILQRKLKIHFLMDAVKQRNAVLHFREQSMYRK